MIDLGISYKQLKQRMEKIGFSPSSIKKVFISHEHTDHVKGLQTFLKNNSDVEIYMHQNSFNQISQKNDYFLTVSNQFKFINSNDIINHNDISIKLIEGAHDSAHCFAFFIYTPTFKLFHATDIGYVNMHHQNYINDSNFVLLESNYDYQMLRENTSYPMKTIQRICSNVGHLSNDDATRVISKLDKNITKYVCFAHLSENNNHYDKVFNANKHIDLNKYILAKDETITIDFNKDNK